MSLSNLPLTSCSAYPKIAVACEFHPVMAPCSSMVTTASKADSTIARVFVSLACKASEACLRAMDSRAGALRIVM